MSNRRVAKLSEVCKVNQGLQIPISERHKEPGLNRKIYITVQYLNGKSKPEYIEDYSSSVVCDTDDLLMTRTGNTGMVITGVAGVFHNNFFKIKPFSNIDSKYLRYNLISPYLQFKLLKLAGTSTIPDLNHGDFYSITIPLPPVEEQKLIVDILETWDKYLERLDQKIQAKNIIKKSLMQQLLTGSLRLSSHDDEWNEITLDKIGSVRTSSVDKLIIDGQKKVKLLNYMDVYKRDHIKSTDQFQTVTAKDQQISSSNLKRGDILFTPSSETQTDIGHSAVVMDDLDDVLFSYHLIRLRPENRLLNYRFSAYAFKTNEFYREFWKRAQGATRYTLSKEAIQESIIKIPTSLDEQIAIAEILEIADDEIAGLQRKMQLAKEQQKYLLNGLLSGKIRVDNVRKPEVQHA